MTAELADLLGFGQAGLFVGFVVFLRVGAAMAVLPAVGERSIPQRIRLVLTLCFTIVVTPAVFTTVSPLAEAGAVIGIFLATEVLAGLAIGLSLRLFILALQTAGAMAAQATSLSQIFGGAAVDPQPAIGHLMVVSGLALAVTAGFHIKAAEFLILSYDMLPPGRFPQAGALADWGVLRIARSFGLAFTLAAPFVIASLIYNIALGVINRAMPQLMVAFVGAPAITAGGLILMLVAMPILLSVWLAAMSGFTADPFGVLP